MKQKSSSTSSSDWKQFTIFLVSTAVLSLLLSYVSVYVIDPYDVFLYSPDLPRKPVAKMPRHWKPGIARKAEFDSVLIGTSSVMLLKPQRLDTKLDARIANLALPAASPWEQLQILDLFRRHHKTLNLVIVGVDEAWCSTDGAGQYLDVGDPALAEGRRLKSWLYAPDFFGQLPPLNARIFQESIRQLKSLLDLEDYGNGNDGYYDFTKKYKERYSEKRIRDNLYGNPPRALPEEREVPESAINRWSFPDIEDLGTMLGSLPTSTRKLLVIPPYHHFSAFIVGSKNKARWAECKRRIAGFKGRIPGLTVIDFLMDSEITLNDDNYWDSTHYNVEIADQLEDIVGDVMAPAAGKASGDGDRPRPYRVLVRS